MPFLQNMYFFTYVSNTFCFIYCCVTQECFLPSLNALKKEDGPKKQIVIFTLVLIERQTDR